jgi:hypothetical protein
MSSFIGCISSPVYNSFIKNVGPPLGLINYKKQRKNLSARLPAPLSLSLLLVALVLMWNTAEEIYSMINDFEFFPSTLYFS